MYLVPGGVRCLGGVPGPGGVPGTCQEGVLGLRGCTLVCGVPGLGGVPSPGGWCTWSGGGVYLVRGVYLVPGGGVPAQVLPLPPVDRHV